MEWIKRRNVSEQRIHLLRPPEVLLTDGGEWKREKNGGVVAQEEGGRVGTEDVNVSPQDSQRFILSALMSGMYLELSLDLLNISHHWASLSEWTCLPYASYSVRGKALEGMKGSIPSGIL